MHHPPWVCEWSRSRLGLHPQEHIKHSSSQREEHSLLNKFFLCLIVEEFQLIVSLLYEFSVWLLNLQLWKHMLFSTVRTALLRYTQQNGKFLGQCLQAWFHLDDRAVKTDRSLELMKGHMGLQGIRCATSPLIVFISEGVLAAFDSFHHFITPSFTIFP